MSKLTTIRFSWRAFLTGLIVSSVAISLFGYFATGTNNFVNFVRFYRDISPEALYYPTARQVQSLVESRYDADKTLVIVGGSSVFRGVGQSSAGVWTSALQQDLGDKFVVLNLAMNGGGATGLPSYMTEFLTKENKKVIYLCDMLPGTWAPQGPNPYYQYIYYDAASRGLLLVSEARSRFMIQTKGKDEQDMFLRSYINIIFNDQEFWQFVQYKEFFTVYTPLMFFSPWIARQYTVDDQKSLIDFHFKSQTSTATDQETAIVRGFARLSVDSARELKGLSIGFPDLIRPKMVIVATGQAPFYVERLEPSEKSILGLFYDRWMAIVQQSGITPVPAYQQLSDDDHWDRVHLNEQGGTKLAQLVAPYVKQKAKDLGYGD